MRLSELSFRPKYEKINVYGEFYIEMERITKPELEEIMRKNTITKGNEVEQRVKQLKIKVGGRDTVIKISGIAVDLAKKVKGWEGLTGEVLKNIMPDLDFGNIKDDEEIEYNPDDVILLLAFGVVPRDDGQIIPFDAFLLNKANILAEKLEEEVIDFEKK